MLTLVKQPEVPTDPEDKWIQRTKFRFFKMVQQQISRLKHDKEEAIGQSTF